MTGPTSPEDVETIRRLYTVECLHVEDIAARFGIKPQSMTRKISVLGFKRPAGYKPQSSRETFWTEKNVNCLIEMVSQGKSKREIQQVLGASSGSIAWKIYSLGLVSQQQKRATRKTYEGIKKVLTQETSPKSLIGQFRRLHRDDIARTTELDLKRCRWPVGDPKELDFGYCGDKRQDGAAYSYCAHHLRIGTRAK